MKIRILRGSFTIERGGEPQAQYCPFCATDEAQAYCCGDWCPHFGEPRKECRHKVNGFGEDVYEHGPGQMLRLCHGTVLVGEIEDRRRP